MTALLGAVSGGAPSVASAAGAIAQGGKYDFDTPYNRFGTNSVKYDQQNRVFGKDAVQVGMGIADMDFRAAPSITKALKERLEHENWGYLDMPAAFLENVAAWNKRRYGVTFDPAQAIIVGASWPHRRSGLLTEGTKVLPTPTYNGFYGDLGEGRRKKVVLKRADGTFAMDWTFRKQISIDTSSFILCNPQNPTGNCWSQADLLGSAKSA
jgi:cystathionine beta-lyase